MSFSIQTNVNSLIAQENLRVNSNFQSQTIQRLTSGFRINTSGDDAAGLAVYKNPDVLPRVWVVHEGVRVSRRFARSDGSAFPSFPNSVWERTSTKLCFVGRGQARNRVSRKAVPKQEFGNEKATTAQLQSWRVGLR